MNGLKKLLLELAPEKLLVQRRYRKEFGVLPDLNNPKLFTEKLQWLKLFDKQELKTICSDKLAVRKYIEEKIGKEYLIPLCFHTCDLDEVNEENLPDFPVIVKPNHDSGGGFIITDKSTYNYELLKSKLHIRLGRNYYHYSGEWEYKNIKPSIVVEKLMYDPSSNITLLNDFKIHCFNGRPEYIQTIFDRDTDVTETWYDKNWNKQPFGYFSKNRIDVPKPLHLTKMLELATLLSKDFKYVRVDLYELLGKVYFGELTFHPFCGVMKWDPRETDLKLGNLLDLDD